MIVFCLVDSCLADRHKEQRHMLVPVLLDIVHYLGQVFLQSPVESLHHAIKLRIIKLKSLTIPLEDRRFEVSAQTQIEIWQEEKVGLKLTIMILFCPLFCFVNESWFVSNPVFFTGSYYKVFGQASTENVWIVWNTLVRSDISIDPFSQFVWKDFLSPYDFYLITTTELCWY